MPELQQAAAAHLDATATMPSALLPLKASNLGLKIGSKHLVNNVSFELGPDDVTVIMGPNGAGKSLLLRLLHGLLKPTSGTITWGGMPVSAATRVRQAMVFQRAVLLRRTVAANIEFALSLAGRAGQGRCENLLEHVGLLDRAKQPARMLSGGEQQRLALARALALEPEVLFLDEPTGNLDPASVLKIEEIVLNAHKRGTKIIFVTHDIGQARRLAGDVVFLQNGAIAERGVAEQFFATPVSKAAKAFLEGKLYV
ncbi:MAG: ATP-binding cassette domain-containing protein [Hyphomicrobiales bacterium]